MKLEIAKRYIGRYIHVEYQEIDDTKGTYFGRLKNVDYLKENIIFDLNPMLIINENGKFELINSKPGEIKSIPKSKFRGMGSETKKSIESFITVMNQAMEVGQKSTGKTYAGKLISELYLTTKMGFRPDP